ncbi:MAG: hypothetical protein Q9187_002807 [Circinaria calcarea]
MEEQTTASRGLQARVLQMTTSLRLPLLRPALEKLFAEFFTTELKGLKENDGMYCLLTAQTIVNNIHELCLHPEYIEILRDEIRKQPALDFNNPNSLPVLDGFMRETNRLNAFDTSKYL